MGARGGEVFREVVNQNIIEMLHRRKVKVSEVRTNVIPHRATTRELFPNGLEGWTAELLRLVYQERQHQQQREDHGQVLPTVAKVVLKLVTLILQRVERLIFHFPTRTTTARTRCKAFSSVTMRSVTQLKYAIRLPDASYSPYCKKFTNRSGLLLFNGRL